MDENTALALGSRYERFVYDRTLSVTTAGAPSYQQTRNPQDSLAEFAADGCDHLTVAAIAGGLPIHVRTLDGDRNLWNPWLRVEVGDVLSRAFTKFQVCTGWAGFALVQTPQRARAVFYASDGPLLQKAERHYGLRRGFLASNSAVDTTGLSLWEILLNIAGITPVAFGGALADRPVPSCGRIGGRLYLHNLDTSNTLLLSSRPNVAAAMPTHPDGFPIVAGAEREFDLDDVLAYPDGGAWLRSSAGTVAFGLLVTSPEFDFGSGESELSAGLAVPLV